ncbi:uncharacterized protein LOC133126382 isoform X2 [Conger conger]|uniref:uncharacterized protein LOC133126382 isoform X2 n=1 Tax=Conger conger TaxID=82655 RepID=UPI002A598A7C|nr:uncharacterized protein LOC133126382 isoform X2 [Conger conger]
MASEGFFLEDDAKEGKVRKEQRQKQEITKIIQDVTAELGKRNWQDQQTLQMKTSRDNKPPQLGGEKVFQNRISDFRFRMRTSIDLYPPSIGGSTGHMQTEKSADRLHALRRMSWPFSISSATSVGGGKVSQNSSSDFRFRVRTSIDLYPPSSGSTGHRQTENSTDRQHALRRRKMWSPFISSATSIGQDSGIHSRLGSFSTSECQAERDASLPPGTGSRKPRRDTWHTPLSKGAGQLGQCFSFCPLGSLVASLAC